MCDLHLPFDKNALQYDALSWALQDALKRGADCILYAGDVTCNGDETVYDFFLETVKSTKIPFLYIPGNSDLRTPETRASISLKASECTFEKDGVLVFALNDCDGTIAHTQLALIEEADENSIIFMHHPISAHKEETVKKLRAWRERHRETKVFFGHLHVSYEQDGKVSLQALDPDKAIGECPCITYYDTDTKTLEKSYYEAGVPDDIYDRFGISCYDTLGHLALATEKSLSCVELREGCLDLPFDTLSRAVDEWRQAGGKNLSLHLPDISLDGDKIIVPPEHDAMVELAKKLGVQRITQHTPRVSKKQAERPDVLQKLCKRLAESFNSIPHPVVIGVENMHTSPTDTDETRRVGCIPEECLYIMELLGKECRHKVGINLDVGHARNNVPYSQKYQVGTWLSMVGPHVVGYHIHQVTCTNGVFENHMPIDDVYGNLISFASFFKCWEKNKINHASIVFEMRHDGDYETTLDTFNKIRGQQNDTKHRRSRV